MMTYCPNYLLLRPGFIRFINYRLIKKSPIRETKHLSTDADSSTDAIGGWTKNTPKPDFFEKRKKSSKTKKTQKRLDIRLWEVGAKRRLNGISKVNKHTHTHGQTIRQTDISTYRKHRPRGPMLRKLEASLWFYQCCGLSRCRHVGQIQGTRTRPHVCRDLAGLFPLLYLDIPWYTTVLFSVQCSVFSVQ